MDPGDPRCSHHVAARWSSPSVALAAYTDQRRRTFRSVPRPAGASRFPAAVGAPAGPAELCDAVLQPPAAHDGLQPPPSQPHARPGRALGEYERCPPLVLSSLELAGNLAEQRGAAPLGCLPDDSCSGCPFSAAARDCPSLPAIALAAPRVGSGRGLVAGLLRAAGQLRALRRARRPAQCCRLPPRSGARLPAAGRRYLCSLGSTASRPRPRPAARRLRSSYRACCVGSGRAGRSTPRFPRVSRTLRKPPSSLRPDLAAALLLAPLCALPPRQGPRRRCLSRRGTASAPQPASVGAVYTRRARH